MGTWVLGFDLALHIVASSKSLALFSFDGPASNYAMIRFVQHFLRWTSRRRSLLEISQDLSQAGLGKRSQRSRIYRDEGRTSRRPTVSSTMPLHHQSRDSLYSFLHPGLLQEQMQVRSRFRRRAVTFRLLHMQAAALTFYEGKSRFKVSRICMGVAMKQSTQTYFFNSAQS